MRPLRQQYPGYRAGMPRGRKRLKLVAGITELRQVFLEMIRQHRLGKQLEQIPFDFTHSLHA
jgi:hypothetical protein